MSDEWFLTSRSGLRKQAKERGAPRCSWKCGIERP